jgi:hypothetical protein
MNAKPMESHEGGKRLEIFYVDQLARLGRLQYIF